MRIDKKILNEIINKHYRNMLAEIESYCSVDEYAENMVGKSVLPYFPYPIEVKETLDAIRGFPAGESGNIYDPILSAEIAAKAEADSKAEQE